MRPSLIMARRRFFVDEIRGGAAEITGDEAAHLTRVLRVTAGQQLEISDNRSVWLAEVTEARKTSVRFRALEPVPSGLALPPIHLYAALFKFDRFEVLVEKATELGVARIVPVESARTEHGLFEAAHKRVERWRRIAKEASQQSRRLQVPEISEPVRLRSLDERGTRIRLDELPGTAPLAIAADWSAEQPISVLTGPEGGWTADERELLERMGWTGAALAASVLRAETAGIAVLSVLAYDWLRRSSEADR